MSTTALRIGSQRLGVADPDAEPQRGALAVLADVAADRVRVEVERALGLLRGERAGRRVVEQRGEVAAAALRLDGGRGAGGRLYLAPWSRAARPRRRRRPRAAPPRLTLPKPARAWRRLIVSSSRRDCRDRTSWKDEPVIRSPRHDPWGRDLAGRAPRAHLRERGARRQPARRPDVAPAVRLHAAGLAGRRPLPRRLVDPGDDRPGGHVAKPHRRTPPPSSSTSTG